MTQEQRKFIYDQLVSACETIKIKMDDDHDEEFVSFYPPSLHVKGKVFRDWINAIDPSMKIEHQLLPNGCLHCQCTSSCGIRLIAVFTD